MRELDRATAVLVDMGGPMAFALAMRRKLVLRNGTATMPLSFGDAIRARVLDGSGTLAYIGVSGGTVLAGEDLWNRWENWTSDGKKQNVMDHNLSGLGLVPNCSFFPHGGSKDSAWLRQA